jgi:hypothetical protein
VINRINLREEPVVYLNNRPFGIKADNFLYFSKMTDEKIKHFFRTLLYSHNMLTLPAMIEV